MSEFYKSSQTKLAPNQPPQSPAAFNLTQKFPDVSAILNSCDEMIKIASHTREKAKILQKQMGELTRAIPMRAATATKRPATVVPSTPPSPPRPVVDFEMHQIHVTTAPKQILSSCSSSSSISSNEQQKAAVVKLKGITTINPVMAATVVPAKRNLATKAGARKTDTNKSVQRVAMQRRVNNVLPSSQKRGAPKTPVTMDRPKARALPNLLPPFKKSSSTNSAVSQMRVTSAKVTAKEHGAGGSGSVSPRPVRTGRD